MLDQIAAQNLADSKALNATSAAGKRGELVGAGFVDFTDESDL